MIEGRWFNPKPLLCRFSHRPCARCSEWVNAHLWWLWVVTDDTKKCFRNIVHLPFIALFSQGHNRWRVCRYSSLQPQPQLQVRRDTSGLRVWSQDIERLLELSHLSLADPDGGSSSRPEITLADALQRNLFWGRKNKKVRASLWEFGSRKHPVWRPQSGCFFFFF